MLLDLGFVVVMCARVMIFGPSLYCLGIIGFGWVLGLIGLANTSEALHIASNFPIN
jgi:hypothetical protein